MAFATVAAVVSIGLGLGKAVSGFIKNKNQADKLKNAKQQFKKMKNLYKNLDTTNPYLNMKNVYEDMTVNQREAEFSRQQNLQSQANIMREFRGAAGGSGIAALAQSLANQGQLAAQKSAVSIGKQEQAIQAAQLKEDSRIQDKEREGEILSRQAEASKVQGLMGMAAAKVAGVQNAKQDAQEQMWSRVGDIATGSLGLSELDYWDKKDED